MSTWSHEKSVYAQLEQCTFWGVATEIWKSYFGLFWSEDIALFRFRLLTSNWVVIKLFKKHRKCPLYNFIPT